MAAFGKGYRETRLGIMEALAQCKDKSLVMESS